jgi:hypothetical protein
MEYVIKGRIRDSDGKPLSGISVNGFDKDLISSDSLGSSKTDNSGHFEMPFNTRDFDRFHVEGEPEVYLEIIDSNKSFKAIKDKQGSYTRDKISGDWNSNIIDSISDIDKYDITIVVQPRKIPDKYETVVIGSGFGGTITSLTVANVYTDRDNSSRKNNNDRLEIYVPLFNIYPGHSQTQNIEITSNRSEKITITNIIFKSQSSGFSFKVNDPVHPDKQAEYSLQLDLFPNTKIGIPTTINLDANQQLENIDFDFEVDVLLTRQQNPTATVTLTIKSHIGHKRVCLLERSQWWVSHEMPSSKEGTTDGKRTIRQYLETNNIPYNTWAYPDYSDSLELLEFLTT